MQHRDGISWNFIAGDRLALGTPDKIKMLLRLQYFPVGTSHKQRVMTAALRAGREY